MSEHTETLLSIRDGEPVAACVRDRLLGDAAAVSELRRLEEIRDALGDLPMMMPPERAWRRLAHALTEPARGVTWRFVQAAGLAGVALIGILTIVMAERLDRGARDPAPLGAVPATAATEPGPDDSYSYTGLIEESARLESYLRALPSDPGLMPVRTASTIVGLEDQIAVIDAELSLGAASDIGPQYRHALWSERVDLMNALVRVRVAHAQRFDF